MIYPYWQCIIPEKKGYLLNSSLSYRLRRKLGQKRVQLESCKQFFLKICTVFCHLYMMAD
jgi:hypothetical protein